MIERKAESRFQVSSDYQHLPVCSSARQFDVHQQPNNVVGVLHASMPRVRVCAQAITGNRPASISFPLDILTHLVLANVYLSIASQADAEADAKAMEQAMSIWNLEFHDPILETVSSLVSKVKGKGESFVVLRRRQHHPFEQCSRTGVSCSHQNKNTDEDSERVCV